MASNLVAAAGMLARDPEFIAWVEHLSCQPCSEADAAEFVRLVCEIESRRELDTNTAAAARFHHHIRYPFFEWRQHQREEFDYGQSA